MAIEGYRDMELDDDSPLGVPSGPVEWKLQGAVLDEEDGVCRLFRQMQLAGELPAGFIGDYAKKSLVAELSGSLDKLRSFAEAFGVKKGIDLASLTSRARVPATIMSTDETTAKVQYVAETPNWTESEDCVSVLVTGWLGEKGPAKNARPIDRTLAPFIAFLMHLTGNADCGADTARTLRVGVIDIANCTTAVWRWSMSPIEARSYLDRITARYMGFLGTARQPCEYVDFTWKKLAKALEGGGDWDNVLLQLTKEEGYGSAKRKEFDNALVVEQSAEKYRRNPTAGELKELYEEFYSLPMSGSLDGEWNGGAK